MPQIIFARDRRRKKTRIKGLIFFIALSSLFIAIVLALKNQSPIQPQQSITIQPLENTVELISQSNHEAEKTPSEAIENTETQDIENPQNEQSEHGSPKEVNIAIASEEEETPTEVDENATSYEDELASNDDEVESSIEQVLSFGEKLPDGAENALRDFLDVAEQALRINEQFVYTVESGDKLRDVFNQAGLESNLAKNLIKQYPELANLKAGQEFYLIFDKDDALETMNWQVSEKQEQIFSRLENEQFSRQILEKKGVWKTEVLSGTIKGDLNASLRSLGLSKRQISALVSGLQWQFSNKKLQAGEKFSILVKREYLDDKVTDLGNVEAIHLKNDGKSYYAILAENGRYYNRHGETLGKGFARQPLLFTARVSSPFNPRRFHPVTHRIAPHKGVDLGVQTGTPVVAPADGVVEHVAYQAGGAGRYIKIRHGQQYTTVYMHLSKTLVKAGQSVKKGERIALSGNTGRSTGPHLHYEFHINDRPVNPMTVKLPGTGSSMPEKDRKSFLQKAKMVETKLKL